MKASNPNYAAASDECLMVKSKDDCYSKSFVATATAPASSCEWAPVVDANTYVAPEDGTCEPLTTTVDTAMK